MQPEHEISGESMELLLKSAVQRAGHIRHELLQLREQAFVAASTEPAALPAPDPSDSRLMVRGASRKLLDAMPQHPTLVLGTPAHGSGCTWPPQLGAPDGGSQSLPFQEQPRAAIKCAAGDHQLVPPLLQSRDSWSIPSSRQQHQQPHHHWYQHQQHHHQFGISEPATGTFPAAEPSPPQEWGHPARASSTQQGTRRGSFEDLIAALRAESVQPPHEAQIEAARASDASAHTLSAAPPPSWQGRHSSGSAPGSGGGSHERHERAACSKARPQWQSGASSGRQQQPQRRPSRADYQQQLAALGPAEAERQLREKLQLVNAAKRYRDARTAPGSHPPAPAASRRLSMPRLPPQAAGTVTATGSATGSQQGSVQRLSGSVDDIGGGQARAAWVAEQGYSYNTCDYSSSHSFPKKALSDEHSPVRSGYGAAAATTAAAEAAAATAAGVNAAPEAGSPASSLKVSRISLTQLLAASPPASSDVAAAAAAASDDAGLSRSSSLRQPAVSSVAGERAASTGLGAPPSAVAAAEAAVAAQAAGLVAAPAVCVVADVVPGELAAPPLQDTPRRAAAAAPVPASGEAPPGPPGEQRGGRQGLAARTHAYGSSKLQSPPSTPLDASLAAAPGELMPAFLAATSAVGSPAASGQASTASSGSPEVRPQQALRKEEESEAAASPVLRAFPSLVPRDLGISPERPARPQQPLQSHQQQQQQQQQQAVHSHQQAPLSPQPLHPVPAASASVGAGPVTGSRQLAGIQLSASASATNIGRKRTGSEVGLGFAEPAGAKKRSPEVVGSSHRLLPRTAELQLMAPAMEAAAAATVGTAGPGGRDAAVEAQEQQQVAAAAAALQATVAQLFRVEAGGGNQQQQQQQHRHQRQQQQGQQQHQQQTHRVLASKAPPSLKALQLPTAAAAADSRMVMPLVLQHSPVQHRRPPPIHQSQQQPRATGAAVSSCWQSPEQQQPQQQQQQQTNFSASSSVSPAAAAEAGAPAAAPAQPLAPAPAPVASASSNDTLAVKAAQPLGTHNAPGVIKLSAAAAEASAPAVAPPPTQRPPRPGAKQPAPAGPPAVPPASTALGPATSVAEQAALPQQQQLRVPPLDLGRSGERSAEVRVVSTGAAALDSLKVSVEPELPSESCWLSGEQARAQQPSLQAQPQRPSELASTSVLLSRRHAVAGTGAAAPPDPAAAAAAGVQHVRQPAAAPQRQVQAASTAPQRHVQAASTAPLPPAPPAAQAAAALAEPPSPAAASPVAAAATPAPTAAPTPRGAAAAAMAAGMTPRRRLASLEPPEAGLSLKQDEYGRHLLGCAPELAGMSGVALLDAMRQGCTVRKAWVRPNFKQGGSTRCVQLAAGVGGRVEALYPHGLFRKPLRFVVKRAVVNSPAWRLGAYLVLDTARGMLRLEPASAAEYARWVLALNAAFQASSGGNGGEVLSHVGDMSWSPAILFG